MKNASTKIPLLDQALTDPDFSILRRGISGDWSYHDIFPVNYGGFNPLTSAAFTAQDSVLSLWLKNPRQSMRLLNESDQLLREIFFMLHDYLHVWAYRAINELMPKLKFGYGKITAENFDAFVFCHLLTEAVATIGVDYWYLSTVDLNSSLDLGSRFSTLATSYHEKSRDEYLKFNPQLQVQTPQFFKLLCEFYCSGIFPGFTVKDLKRSPMTMAWLRHEITYGETQREYSRRWIGHLGNIEPENLDATISTEEKWKQKLMQLMSELLWDKIKKNTQHSFHFKFDPKTVWQTDATQASDFRFTNLNRLDPATAAKTLLAGVNVDENFRYFFQQYVSAFDYSKFDIELIKLFDFLTQKKDFVLVEHLFRNQKRVPQETPGAQPWKHTEPLNLFFLN